MHEHQRNWDALLILHWRKFSRVGSLFSQAEQMFGKTPHELKKEGLIRVPEFVPFKMGVRTFIAEFLKPLSDKLWDIDDNKRVLDWLNASTGLDISADKRNKKYYNEAAASATRSELHAQQTELSKKLIYGSGRKMDNPNQVKATGRIRK